MLWHPKTLQNLAMYNVFFIFGRFSIAGKLPFFIFGRFSIAGKLPK